MMIDEHTNQRSVFFSEHADLLERIEQLRIDVKQHQEKERQATLGQFLTPASVARFMASLLQCASPIITLLDAGAGIGSLFAACVACLCERAQRPQKISVTAYEIDPTLIGFLRDTSALCASICEHAGIEFIATIHQKDFLVDSVERLETTLFSDPRMQPSFNCIVLNPPYRKIHTQSDERRLLQRVGIESSNLYTGFLALATRFLDPQGELVAITPRSFCNGPYFKHFRQHFLQSMSLRQLHVFDSRTQAFQDDTVLQENIIISATRDAMKPGLVRISSSAGPTDDFILVHDVPYEQVVHPDDPQLFIHVLQDQSSSHVVTAMDTFQTSLSQLGLTVSTGKVVDFRAADAIRPSLEAGCIPLLYPTHVGFGSITWPKSGNKKPSALVDDDATQGLQVPNEHYVLVKRFSSKEEKRRIVAAVHDPTLVPGSRVGFENHLNYFHQNGRGMPVLLARGLVGYLNSTLVDAYFRQFNGHTQVNATDLRNISYPTRAQLEALGARIPFSFPTQQELDQILQEEFPLMQDVGAQEAQRRKQCINEALADGERFLSPYES